MTNARGNARSIAKADATGQCTYGRTYGRTNADAVVTFQESLPLVTRAHKRGGFVDG